MVLSFFKFNITLVVDDSNIRPKLAYEYAARQAGDRANLGYTS